MRNIFKRFFVLFILASLALPGLVIFAPQMSGNLTEIWASQIDEETENAETKTEKVEKEKENVEYDWLDSLNTFQLVLNSAPLSHNKFFNSYLSPTLSFLGPPPELLS